MRVTDSYRTNSLMSNIESSLDGLNSVQQQIATGKKMIHPSDDPAGASQSLALRTSVLGNGQYLRDAQQATTYLKASDSALGDVSNLLISARQIASQGANSTQDADSLNSLAQQVDGIIKQVTTLANTDVHGKYIFSGTQTHTPAYSSATPPVWQGDEGAVTATLGPNDTMTLNQNASGSNQSLFSGSLAALQTLKTDLTSLAAGTGTISAVSSDIQSLDTATGTVGIARANIGAKLNDVTATSQRLQRAQTQYGDGISQVEDVDLAQAYVQLQSEQNVYQASLVTVSKAYQHSLADYL